MNHIFTFQTFIDDIEQFRDRIADLDRRIGRIANQAFADCNSLEGMFKLIHIFGSLLDRPIIHHDFENNYPIILEHIEREMDDAKQIFDQQMEIQDEQGSIQLDRNMPKVAGSLMWAEELKQRYTQPIEQFRALENELDYLKRKNVLIIKIFLLIIQSNTNTRSKTC